MLVEATVFKRDKIQRFASTKLRADLSFAKALDLAIVQLCQDLAIPLPLWLKKNTREFVRFRQTEFWPDQFMDQVVFDRFLIKLMEDG